jgi:hypothetical protein
MNSQTGAVTCYSDVKNCVKNSKYIFASIFKIDSSTLSFLNEVKYDVSLDCGSFYKTGDNSTSWLPKANCVLDLYSVLIDDNQYCLDMRVRDYRNAICHLKTVGCLTFNEEKELYFGKRDNWWILDGN